LSEADRLPWARPAQVLLRTAHIMAMALLLGGLALGAGYERLKASIAATILSGLLLLLLDLAKGSTALTQGSGAAVLLKLMLLGLGCLFPRARFEWYLAATAVASIGAHMPGRWRHFSWVSWKVISPRG
jgi:hypothetical protein